MTDILHYSGFWLQFQRYQSELPGVSELDYTEAFLELDQNGYVEKPIVYHELLSQFSLDTRLEPVLTADYFEKVAQFAVAFPEALETLQELSMSYTLGVVTNGPALLQQQVIEQLGLYWHCQALIISEAVGLRKPGPESLRDGAARGGGSSIRSRFCRRSCRG